jgi:hypothetical protein
MLEEFRKCFQEKVSSKGQGKRQHNMMSVTGETGTAFRLIQWE